MVVYLLLLKSSMSGTNSTKPLLTQRRICGTVDKFVQILDGVGKSFRGLPPEK